MARRFEIDAKSAPDRPGMMLATIEALKELGGSATVQELEEKVIELEGVTEAEQEFTMPNDRRSRVNYYLAWARTQLKYVDALVNSSRGVWALTKRGAEITSLEDAREAYEEAVSEVRERSRKRRQDSV